MRDLLNQVSLILTRWEQTAQVTPPPVNYRHDNGRYWHEKIQSHNLETKASVGFCLGGPMPPCRLRRRKFDYEMVNSEVYLNKYYNNNNNHHQLDQSVITHITSTLPPFRKLLFFACFRLLIILSIFPRGSGNRQTCGRPCLEIKERRNPAHNWLKHCTEDTTYTTIYPHTRLTSRKMT